MIQAFRRSWRVLANEDMTCRHRDTMVRADVNATRAPEQALMETSFPLAEGACVLHCTCFAFSSMLAIRRPRDSTLTFFSHSCSRRPRMPGEAEEAGAVRKLLQQGARNEGLVCSGTGAEGEGVGLPRSPANGCGSRRLPWQSAA